MATAGKSPGKSLPEFSATREHQAAELSHLLANFSLESLGLGQQHEQTTGDDGVYRALLDLSPLVVWISDFDGGVIYINRHWLEYSGQDADEASGAGWINRVHPKDRETVAQAWHTAADALAPFEYEARLQRKDGQDRWHLSKVLPLKNEQGKVARWLGIAMDVHERKMTAAAVADAEEHLRYTLEAAGVGSCAFYPCIEKKEWSGRSADMLAIPRDEPPTLARFMSRVHPDDVQEVMQKVGALLESPVSREYDFDYRILWPDGTVRWLLSRGKYIVPPPGSGDVAGMKGILLDITERKQAEEDKKKLEEQLRQAQKMEAIGRLASGIAHDFNNLLTIIRGAAERLQKRLPGGSGDQQTVQTIHESAERASALTEQLLAFGRQQMALPRALDVNQVILKLQVILQRLAGKNIALNMHLQEDLWNVKMDPIQIDQILLNLAANARDAMPHGGAITLETSNRTVNGSGGAPAGLGPGQYVCLSFSDSGEGIEAETLGHIFEPFFTTKEPGQGAGLGLSTVYGIVQQNGGQISVSTVPGQGTVFTLHFPRSTEEAQATEGAAATIGAEQDLCGSESILLVEDEPSLRAILAEHIGEHGYSLHEAANAREAEELAAVRKIDLLITDLVMPGSGGGKLARALAACHPGLRVIFISGYAKHAALEEALRQPNTFFMQKPFRLRDLLVTIRHALDSEASF